MASARPVCDRPIHALEEMSWGLTEPFAMPCTQFQTDTFELRLHRHPNGVEDFRLGFREWAFDEGAGGRFVTATAKLFGQLAAINVQAAAEADFEIAARLFNHDHGHLRPADVESHV